MPDKYKVLSQPVDFNDEDAVVKLLATADGVSRFIFGTCVIDTPPRLYLIWKCTFEGEEYAGAIEKPTDPERLRRDRYTLFLQAYQAIESIQKRANGG